MKTASIATCPQCGEKVEIVYQGDGRIIPPYLECKNGHRFKKCRIDKYEYEQQTQEKTP